MFQTTISITGNLQLLHRQFHRYRPSLPLDQLASRYVLIALSPNLDISHCQPCHRYPRHPSAPDQENRSKTLYFGNMGVITNEIRATRIVIYSYQTILDCPLGIQRSYWYTTFQELHYTILNTSHQKPCFGQSFLCSLPILFLCSVEMLAVPFFNQLQPTKVQPGFCAVKYAHKVARPSCSKELPNSTSAYGQSWD